jgi:hypothetical protein
MLWEQPIVLLITAAASMRLLESSDRIRSADRAKSRRFLGYAIIAPAIAWATMSGIHRQFGIDALALIVGGLLEVALDCVQRRKNGVRT